MPVGKEGYVRQVRFGFRCGSRHRPPHRAPQAPRTVHGDGINGGERPLDVLDGEDLLVFLFVLRDERILHLRDGPALLHGGQRPDLLVRQVAVEHVEVRHRLGDDHEVLPEVIVRNDAHDIALQACEVTGTVGKEGEDRGQFEPRAQTGRSRAHSSFRSRSLARVPLSRSMIGLTAVSEELGAPGATGSAFTETLGAPGPPGVPGGSVAEAASALFLPRARVAIIRQGTGGLCGPAALRPSGPLACVRPLPAKENPSQKVQHPCSHAVVAH